MENPRNSEPMTNDHDELTIVLLLSGEYPRFVAADPPVPWLSSRWPLVLLGGDNDGPAGRFRDAGVPGDCSGEVRFVDAVTVAFTGVC
jgi:hypothetical protein